MNANPEARLGERISEATEDFKKVFGFAPGRWLQMEAESGTLGACQRILASDDFVSQMTPLWEKGLLHQTVEAVVLEPEFAPLFSHDEKAVARRRLTELGFEVR